MLWTVTGLAVEAMLQVYSVPVKVFGIIPADSSVVGTIYYKNHFAALMELVAPIALWEVKNGKLLSGGMCFAALFAATVTSASRAGTIGLLGELLVFMAIMVLGRQLRLGSALAVTGALALLVIAAVLVAGPERIWQRMQESHPYHLREQLARSTVEMIAERPSMGFGMGTWRFVYPRFARFDDSLIANEAHNDLAQWASEGGVPFLLFMTALIALLGKRIVQSVWGFGLVAVFVHCYVDYALRFPPLQFLWFAMAGALTQFDSRSERRSQQSDLVSG
jgi:O-antigen ligase